MTPNNKELEDLRVEDYRKKHPYKSEEFIVPPFCENCEMANHNLGCACSCHSTPPLLQKPKEWEKRFDEMWGESMPSTKGFVKEFIKSIEAQARKEGGEKYLKEYLKTRDEIIADERERIVNELDILRTVVLMSDGTTRQWLKNEVIKRIDDILSSLTPEEPK